MERLIWSSLTENFRRKRDFLKGSPKFLNGISKRKIYVPFAPCYYFKAFWLLSVPVKNVLGHGTRTSHRSFLSGLCCVPFTAMFDQPVFRLNGKQPVTHFDSDALLTFLGWPTLFFFLNP